MTATDARAIRAQHTCIMQASSMRCLACNRGVPYPALTAEEINDALGLGRRERKAAERTLLPGPRRRR